MSKQSFIANFDEGEGKKKFNWKKAAKIAGGVALAAGAAYGGHRYLKQRKVKRDRQAASEARDKEIGRKALEQQKADRQKRIDESRKQGEEKQRQREAQTNADLQRRAEEARKGSLKREAKSNIDRKFGRKANAAQYGTDKSDTRGSKPGGRVLQGNRMERGDLKKTTKGRSKKDKSRIIAQRRARYQGSEMQGLDKEKRAGIITRKNLTSERESMRKENAKRANVQRTKNINRKTKDIESENQNLQRIKQRQKALSNQKGKRKGGYDMGVRDYREKRGYVRVR